MNTKHTTIALIGLVFTFAGCDQGSEEPACTDASACAGSCSGPGCGSPTSGSAGLAGTASSAGSNAGGNGGSGNLPTGGSSSAGSSTVAGSGNNGGNGGVSLGGNAGSGNSGGASAGMGGAGQAGGGAAGAGNVVGQCKDDFWPAAQNGSVTRYDFKQGTSLPACAYAITHTGSGSDGDWDTVEGISTGDGGYFGAMNTEDYAQGAACGACVEANYNGKKVVLTIVDECPVGSNPVCTKGHIDLSRKAIRQLEPNSNLENLKNVSWHYVKCPAAGNAKVRLHPNQNGDWKPVVIENGLYPLKSVTLNGVNATRSGNNSGGNAWIASGQKPPYAVHATDVNNNAISFSYNGDSGLKDAGTQFMCK